METMHAVPALDEALLAINDREALAKTEAARLASTYFHGTGDAQFSGAAFEHLGHPWNRPTTLNEITPSDLLALGTLMVPLERLSAVELLSPDFQARATALLERIPENASIGSENAPELLAPDGAASQLYELVRDVDGMGKTRTSKLLARKRPGLIPIRDENVERALGGTSLKAWWLPFHAFVTAPRDADGRSYFELAAAIHDVVGLDRLVTPLRTLDAILWRLGAQRD